MNDPPVVTLTLSPVGATPAARVTRAAGTVPIDAWAVTVGTTTALPRGAIVFSDPDVDQVNYHLIEMRRFTAFNQYLS